MTGSGFAETLKSRWFPPESHPYRHFEREIAKRLARNTALLDAGCGRSLDLYKRFGDRTSLFVGLDLECPTAEPVPGRALVCGDLTALAFRDNTFDLVVSRSVLEHLSRPEGFYSEVRRVLRPGGWCIFLTPNLWDYSALISKMLPNRWHPWIVSRTEGRSGEDTFPAYYKSNTIRDVSDLVGQAGLEIELHEYLGQYPSYLMFNGPLFLAGSLYEKIISRFHALRFLRGWLLVVVRKPPSEVRIANGVSAAECSESVQHA